MYSTCKGKNYKNDKFENNLQLLNIIRKLFGFFIRLVVDPKGVLPPPAPSS